MEHRGAIALAATSDASWTQCHANLITRGAPTTFARHITSFATDHPGFAYLRERRSDPEKRAAAHSNDSLTNILNGTVPPRASR